MSDRDLFRLFWLNTRLGAATMARFGEGLARPLPDPPTLGWASAPIQLAMPGDALAKAMARRRSGREFAPAPLKPRALGSLFSAFTPRAYASAGGLYPLEVFALCNHVQGPLNRQAAWYQRESHGLVPLGPIPAWDELAPLVNLELRGIPHLLVLFVLFPERILCRYGARGGRLALIEVGHAAQNLALRLAHDGLVGCEAGGCFDDPLLGLLRLDSADAGLALAFACGLGR